MHAAQVPGKSSGGHASQKEAETQLSIIDEQNIIQIKKHKIKFAKKKG